MRHYEIMYILSPILSEEDKKRTIEQIKDFFSEKNHASIESENEWGSKVLAYPIKHHTRGYYVVLNVKVEDQTAITEFNRYVKTSEKVIRYIVIRRK